MSELDIFRVHVSSKILETIVYVILKVTKDNNQFLLTLLLVARKDTVGDYVYMCINQLQQMCDYLMPATSSRVKSYLHLAEWTT